MINKKLLSFDRKALRYVGLNVLFQWLGMLCNVVLVMTVSRLIGGVFAGSLTGNVLWQGMLLCLLTVPVRYGLTLCASDMSDRASKDVKRTLRSSIYAKFTRLGAGYSETVATSEAVMLASEGVEQIDTYFAKYLPQLFYSLLAPVTLFVLLVGVHARSAILLLAADFFLPLRLLGSYFHIAMNGAASAEKIFRLLSAQEPEDGEKTADPADSTLALEHVTFGYEKERTILHDVSLTIPQGSFVSLVGESGCGKSTIAAILSGARTATEGEVTLGGIPVSEWKQADRLRLLTLVPHNAAIFKGTVEANLRMARPDAAEAELWAALEQVNLADFCRSQSGLATALHEGGSNLSGGQRQRLAMARALLHDSPIYVFDEATSNVDAESENDMMKAIHSLAGKKTVILISHRLANVVDSDCIYVLEAGRIAEQGTHNDLLAAQGVYSRLYNAQKQLEDLGEVSA